MYSDFQTQVFILLLLLMITMALFWFFLLDSYFRFLEKHDESLFARLGTPDLRRFKMAKEMELLRHLFSDPATLKSAVIEEESILKEFLSRQRRIKNFFLIYIFVFIMVCMSVVTLI